MKKIVFAALLVSAIAAGTVSVAETAKAPAAKPAKPAATNVQAGSPAPALKVLKWVKGTPVTSFQKGKTYVVEFWATWCGPCRKSIPHLTELAKKYQGKITFIGVSVWDSTDPATRKPFTQQAYIDNATKFVKEQGAQMSYNVALDDMGGTMAKTWMEAAKQQGIPTAFVIASDGKIAYIGHPMELDSVLDKVLTKGFDAVAFAKKRAETAAAMANVQKLLQEGKAKESIEAADKLIAKDPSAESSLGYLKFAAMLEATPDTAMAYGRKLVDGVYKNDDQGLQMIFMGIAYSDKLKQEDYEFGLAVGEKVDAKAGAQEPFSKDCLALVCGRLGNWDKAVEYEQKAIDILTAMPGAEQIIPELKKRLEAFKSHTLPK